MVKKKIEKHIKALIPTRDETYLKRRLTVQPLTTEVAPRKKRVTAAATGKKMK